MCNIVIKLSNKFHTQKLNQYLLQNSVFNYRLTIFNNNMCSVAVLLEVSKAFDKVWLLSNFPLPRSAAWLLRSYLTKRSFKIYVKVELLTERLI